MTNDTFIAFLLASAIATSVTPTALLYLAPLTTFEKNLKASIYYVFSVFPLMALSLVSVLLYQLNYISVTTTTGVALLSGLLSAWAVYSGMACRAKKSGLLLREPLFLINVFFAGLVLVTNIAFFGTIGLTTIGLFILNIAGLMIYTGVTLQQDPKQHPGSRLFSLVLIIIALIPACVFLLYISQYSSLLNMAFLVIASNIIQVLMLGASFTLFLFDQIIKHQNEARIDYLSGIYNRRAFMHKMNEARTKNLLAPMPGVIAMCDIDHFKRINDEYGHDVGDIAIQAMASILKSSLRETDLYGRMGGEEFAFYISDSDEQTALQVLERIRITIEENELRVGDEVIQFTASFGYAPITRELSVEASLKLADEAMYTSKESGRNRISYVDGGTSK